MHMYLMLAMVENRKAGRFDAFLNLKYVRKWTVSKVCKPRKNAVSGFKPFSEVNIEL